MVALHMVRCTCAMLYPLIVLEVYKVVVVASPPVPIPCPGIFTGISRKFTLKYLYIYITAKIPGHGTGGLF